MPDSLTSVLDRFASPPPAYRSAPQWSLNGDLSEEHIRARLREFADKGIGGLFAHARPGLITGYLSDRWLELWDFAAREAQRLGIDFHIYDEFCCPAGNAAGQVVAEKPHLAQQLLTLTVYTGIGPRPAGEHLAFFTLGDDGLPQPADHSAMSDASSAKPVLALTLKTCSGKGGFGGMPDADLLRRETTDTFLKVTHEAYAKRSSDLFGTAIRFVFSDEPYLSGSHAGLPMSRELFREFYKDHGYALEARLGELCFTQPRSSEVRFDYFWTVNRLFNQNFMRPMHDWCEQHKLRFTGHLMEHEWPSPLSHPDAMASMRWMHAPGNDLLGFQFAPTTLVENGIYLLNLKELSSLTNQLGREWTMVESCGAKGYDAAYELFKPCEDWLLAHGVNLMDPHLSHETVSGARKYDWPQTLSEHSPWWDCYKSQTDHVARANVVLSAGREHNRVLVLHPTTTGWLHYEHPQLQPSARRNEPMEHLRASQIMLLLKLTADQIDYDLGDEFLLEEFGRVEGKRLRVGERLYDVVIIPPAMQNLCSSTLELLRKLVAAGGQLMALNTPEYVDGRTSDAPKHLVSGALQFPDIDALISRVRSVVPPRLATPAGFSLPGQLAWRRAEIAPGLCAWFFCNPWSTEIDVDVALPGGSALELDTASGASQPLNISRRDGKLIAHLHLHPRGHALWMVSDTPAAAAPVPVRQYSSSIPLADGVEITRLSDNLLVVDYCDIEVGGRCQRDLNTLHADTLNWQWQGFGSNPWRGQHQFRDTTVHRQIDPGSTLTITYRIQIDDSVPAAVRNALRLGIERPWLYRIDLNGQQLSQQSAQPWFDEHMRAFPSAGHLRVGENVLTLTANPFHILCEIMPIYVLGDFNVIPQPRGFTLTAPARAPQLQDLAQTAPFYGGWTRYRFSFDMPRSDGVQIQLPRWSGSAARASLDGKPLGPILHPPYSIDVPEPIAPGRHQLDIEICGNMQNMMGPFHSEGLAGAWTWERCPAHQPPGADYRFRPTGLVAPPVIRSRA